MYVSKPTMEGKEEKMCVVEEKKLDVRAQKSRIKKAIETAMRLVRFFAKNPNFTQTIVLGNKQSFVIDKTFPNKYMVSAKKEVDKLFTRKKASGVTILGRGFAILNQYNPNFVEAYAEGIFGNYIKGDKKDPDSWTETDIKFIDVVTGFDQKSPLYGIMTKNMATRLFSLVKHYDVNYSGDPPAVPGKFRYMLPEIFRKGVLKTMIINGIETNVRKMKEFSNESACEAGQGKADESDFAEINTAGKNAIAAIDDFKSIQTFEPKYPFMKGKGTKKKILNVNNLTFADFSKLLVEFKKDKKIVLSSYDKDVFEYYKDDVVYGDLLSNLNETNTAGATKAVFLKQENDSFVAKEYAKMYGEEEEEEEEM
uniref:Uncharacterized protein n=1 Tax=Pithovirus LCDPAC01 TaxID=2506600 RepID=A0A481YNT6_9VIRU|nr:MAG: hypothetical protein LCDPAC01_02280 [Pithovirus LCDPAC01]